MNINIIEKIGNGSLAVMALALIMGVLTLSPIMLAVALVSLIVDIVCMIAMFKYYDSQEGEA